VFFFQAEDGIRDDLVTGVQTCALPISPVRRSRSQLHVPAAARVRSGGPHESRQAAAVPPRLRRRIPAQAAGPARRRLDLMAVSAASMAGVFAERLGPDRLIIDPGALSTAAIDGHTPRFIVRPASIDHVAAVLAIAWDENL